MRILLFSAFVAVALASSSPVPFALWSSVDSTLTSSISPAKVAVPADVEGLLDGVKQHQKPEVLVAFLSKSLDSAAASRSLGAYSTSPSSSSSPLGVVLAKASALEIPFLDLQTKSLSGLLLDHKPQGAKVVALDLESQLEEGVSSCNMLLQHLSETLSELTSNGLMDLVLVHHQEGESQHASECLQKVLAQLASTPLAVLASADRPACQVDTDFAAATHGGRSLLEEDSFVDAGYRQLLETGAAASNVSTGNVVYVSPDIMAGLLLGFMLLFFLLVAVSALMSVESPKRFSSRPLGVREENS